MKHAAQCAERLASLLEELMQSVKGDPPANDESALDVLVQSMLMWEATTEKATLGMQKLRDGCVDYNDMRVNVQHEIIEMLGVRYPRVEERADRLRAMLRDVFLREHDMTLARLGDMDIRELRHYFQSLSGITPYAAARVLLVVFGVHAIPVDEQLRQALINNGAADESADVEDLATWLGKQIPQEQALQSHRALQMWIDSGAAKKRRSRGNSSRKKTSTSSKRTTSNQRSSTKSSGSGTSAKKGKAEADIASE